MPTIEQHGASLVAISPQLPEWSAKISRRHGLEFDVLSDPGNQVAESYGLRFTVDDATREVYQGFGLDLEKYNGDDSWTLPLPARFVIATDGTIAAVEAHPDYTRRPEPEDTVAVLASLSS